MTISDRDIRRQVASVISANGAELAEGVDLDGVTDEIVRTYGLINVHSIDSDRFWALVERHRRVSPAVIGDTSDGSIVRGGFPVEWRPVNR